MRDDLENHSQGRSFRAQQWLNVIRFQREIYQDFINLARKSCQEYFSDTHWSRSESGKEIFGLQTLRSWENWTRRNSTLGGSMQKMC